MTAVYAVWALNESFLAIVDDCTPRAVAHHSEDLRQFFLDHILCLFLGNPQYPFKGIRQNQLLQIWASCLSIFRGTNRDDSFCYFVPFFSLKSTIYAIFLTELCSFAVTYNWSFCQNSACHFKISPVKPSGLWERLPLAFGDFASTFCSFQVDLMTKNHPLLAKHS